MRLLLLLSLDPTRLIEERPMGTNKETQTREEASPLVTNHQLAQKVVRGGMKKQSRSSHFLEVEVIIIIIIIVGRLLLGGGGGGRGSGITTGGTGSSSSLQLGEGLRIGKKILVHLGLLEGVLGLDGDGEDLLEGADHQVRDSGLGGVVHSQRDGGDLGDSVEELGQEVVLGQIQDLGGVQAAGLEDLLDGDTEEEGLDLELTHQSDHGGVDGLALTHQLVAGDDLDGTTNNLGGNVHGLEPSGLSRVQTGGTGLNPDIARRHQTDTGGGRDLLGLDHVTHTLEITLVGEDKTDVALDDGDSLLDGGVGVLTEDLTDDSVLAHEDLGLSTERNAHGLELLGTDVVDVDDQEVLVLGEVALELLDVLDFLLLLDGQLLERKAFKGGQNNGGHD